MNLAARARLLPVAILALAILALLKIGNAWIGFASVNATENNLTETVVAVQSANSEISDRALAANPGLPEQASEVERRILEKLADRHASLEMRERQLETREALLLAAEQKIEMRLKTFEQERVQLERMRTARAAGESEEIATLVSTYEKMKAKDAARIFNALDEDILVPVASGMRTQALAGVLAEMVPDNARQLTKLLAQRNKLDQHQEQDG